MAIILTMLTELVIKKNIGPAKQPSFMGAILAQRLRSKWIPAHFVNFRAGRDIWEWLSRWFKNLQGSQHKEEVVL